MKESKTCIPMIVSVQSVEAQNGCGSLFLLVIFALEKYPMYLYERSAKDHAPARAPSSSEYRRLS
jgi:hypothetical protein